MGYNNTNGLGSNDSNNSNSFVRDSLTQIGDYLTEDLTKKGQSFKVYIAEKKAKRLEKQELQGQEEELNKKAIYYYKKYLARKHTRKQNLSSQDKMETSLLNEKYKKVALQSETKTNQNTRKTQILVESNPTADRVPIPKGSSLANDADRHEFLLDFFKKLAVSRQRQNASALETKTAKQQDFVSLAKDFEKNANPSFTTNMQHQDFQLVEAKLQLEDPKLEVKKELSKGFSKRIQSRIQLNPDVDRLVLRRRSSPTFVNEYSQPSKEYQTHACVSPSLNNGLSHEMTSSSLPLFLNSPGFFIAATGVTLKIAVSNSKNKVLELAVIGTYSNVMKVVDVIKSIPKRLINLRGGHRPEGPQLGQDEFFIRPGFEKTPNNPKDSLWSPSEEGDFSDFKNLNFVPKEQNEIYPRIPYQPSFYKQEQDRRNNPKWKKPNKVDIALKIAWDYLVKFLKLLKKLDQKNKNMFKKHPGMKGLEILILFFIFLLFVNKSDFKKKLHIYITLCILYFAYFCGEIFFYN